MTEPCEPTPTELSLLIDELDKRFELHRLYQMKAVDKAHEELQDRLRAMNQFREAMRDQAMHFVTLTTFDERAQRLQDNMDGAKLRLEEKITSIEKVITPNLGTRVNVLEQAKANLDGRFLALGAILILLELILQAWPLLVRHTP